MRRGDNPPRTMLGGGAMLLSGGGRDGSQQTLLAGMPRGVAGSEAARTSAALMKSLRRKYGSRLSSTEGWSGFRTA